MHGKLIFLSFLLLLLFHPVFSTGQEATGVVTPEEKTAVYNNFKNFKAGFYIDTYLNIALDNSQDTAGIAPFSANCPATGQIRLNVAAAELFYDAEKVRAKLQIQFGDAPNLLTSPEKQWIKNIRQANFGFRIGKKNWIDLGYMFTPVGIESSWPVFNTLSTVSVCGYFEPGAFLGVKFTRNFSEKVSGGFMFGNPYSLAYQQNDHLTGILFLNYKPLNNLTLAYNNIFGNQALRNAQKKNNLLYNDILIIYDPHPRINITGQFDFAFQTNSKMAPDTTSVASMCSGFVQVRLAFLTYFTAAMRYDYFYDPDGFLSGTYTYEGITTGLTSHGLTLGLEYRPIKYTYIRAEYKYLHANRGNSVFYSGTSDYMQAFIFTAGFRFN